MVEGKIIERVRKFVKELKKQKIKVTKVILYGSRVSGKAHEYSDIDCCYSIIWLWERQI